MQRGLYIFRALWTYLFCWMKNHSCLSTVSVHPETAHPFFFSRSTITAADTVPGTLCLSAAAVSFNTQYVGLFSLGDEQLLIENHFITLFIPHSRLVPFFISISTWSRLSFKRNKPSSYPHVPPEHGLTPPCTSQPHLDVCSLWWLSPPPHLPLTPQHCHVTPSHLSAQTIRGEVITFSPKSSGYFHIPVFLGLPTDSKLLHTSSFLKHALAPTTIYSPGFLPTSLAVCP